MSSDADQRLGPEWIAHRFDEATNQIRFVEYDRETRASVPFLTDTYLPEKPFRAESRPRAMELAGPPAPVHFIFHSGFCCSTLFASCFDQPGLATNLSEPMILNDATGWRRRGAPPAEVGRLVDDALNLLARPFAGDQAAVIKPSTIINALTPAIMRIRPTARAIVMHAPLQDFVTSIAKKGLDGRLWARELFLGMRKEGLVEGLGFDDEQYFGQTDLQIAAIAWLGQQRLFAQLIESYPDRVRSLDSKTFLDSSRQAIEAAAQLFGLNVEPAQLDRAAAETLGKNSKNGKPFGRESREADYQSARSAHGDEIEKVTGWASAVADSAGIRTGLAAPLI